jgi:hypothetical protein
MPLYSGSAQACERHKIFDNKQLAGEAGIWHLVIGIWQNVATLCLLGLGLGKCFVCNRNGKKAGEGSGDRRDRRHRA